MKKDIRVPWVHWLGGDLWECDRCGRTGTWPTGCSLPTLGRFLKDLMGEHAKCKESDEPAEPEAEPCSAT